MRCLVCEDFAFSPLCKQCQSIYLHPNPRIRTLECGLKVLYFFEYDEIDLLLKTKHIEVGHAIFRLLSTKILKPFANAFEYHQKVNVVPIDDNVNESYSHTAVMAHAAKSNVLVPTYNHLKARSRVHYSQQSLEFRKNNPRDFKYAKTQYHPVILMDDIVTTGTTLSEAKHIMQTNGHDVLMGVVFASVL